MITSGHPESRLESTGPWGFRFRCPFSGLAHGPSSSSSSSPFGVALRLPSAGLMKFCWHFATFAWVRLHPHLLRLQPGLFLVKQTPKTASIRGHGHGNDYALPRLLFSVIFGLSSRAALGPASVWRPKPNETKRNVPPARLHFPALAACHQLPVACWRRCTVNISLISVQESTNRRVIADRLISPSACISVALGRRRSWTRNRICVALHPLAAVVNGGAVVALTLAAKVWQLLTSAFWLSSQLYFWPHSGAHSAYT